MEHRMDVLYSCRCCGRTETLIFLEPVGVDMVRSDTIPPGWRVFPNGVVLCKECLEGQENE